MIRPVTTPVSPDEMRQITNSYLDDDRQDAEIWGRVGSGLIAAMKKAEEIGIIKILRKLS